MQNEAGFWKYFLGRRKNIAVPGLQARCCNFLADDICSFGSLRTCDTHDDENLTDISHYKYQKALHTGALRSAHSCGRKNRKGRKGMIFSKYSQKIKG